VRDVKNFAVFQFKEHYSNLKEEIIKGEVPTILRDRRKSEEFIGFLNFLIINTQGIKIKVILNYQSRDTT
jgi:hypothetical protein